MNGDVYLVFQLLYSFHAINRISSTGTKTLLPLPVFLNEKSGGLEEGGFMCNWGGGEQ